MMSHKQSTNARRIYAPQHKVLTNDDLLTQILIRLPILCIRLFTTVSKQWLRILTSPDFTRNRSQIRNIDPPAGLFVNHITSSFHCVFVSLDTRIKSRKYTSDNSFTLGYTESVDNVNILQSCNGLLLCTGWEGTHFYYVYNPSTNLVKMLPETDYAHDDSNFYGCAGLRLAFDPTKSPDYKVVRAGRNSCEIVIQIYSSESGLESGQLGPCAGKDYVLFILYISMHAFDYIYNPSSNLLKILPEPDYANVDSNVYGCAGLRLAFDPTKSPYYKVGACWGRHNFLTLFIQIYYSEKGNWSLCNERFNYFFFLHFDSAMYWNNALHWLETENSQLTHYKLNIEYPDHPIITIIQIPQSLQQGRNFFKSYGNILFQYKSPIQIPHHIASEFESIGCLVLVRRDCIGSNRFTIYEMNKGCFVWSSKYIVNTDDFMNPLPEGWSIRSIVWRIVLGEREKDSFLIINFSAKVVQYNLISKTLREIYDMGSNEIADDYLHGFIPPYAM
ncbi:receptor-like serine/threonine-protein kinase SD1-8 [Tanacetum coccineum]